MYCIIPSKKHIFALESIIYIFYKNEKQQRKR